MPFEYVVDAAQNLVFSTYMGTVTDEDLCDHVRRMTVDPRVEPGYLALVDTTGVKNIRVTSKGTRKVWEIEEQSLDARKIRIAVVIAQDLMYSFCRAYQILAGPFQTKVGIFRTVEEAARWLGVTVSGFGIVEGPQAKERSARPVRRDRSARSVQWLRRRKLDNPPKAQAEGRGEPETKRGSEMTLRVMRYMFATYNRRTHRTPANHFEAVKITR